MHRLILCLLAGLSLLSCLDTREVEPPVTTSSDWVSPTDYQTLLVNLEKSVSQQNIQNYLRCFNQDSLKFTPATSVFTGNQILWDNWSWQDEQAWCTNVLGDLGITSGNYLSLREVDFQSFSGDSLRYIGDYELVMNHTDTSLTVRFKGQLEFLMSLNTYNEWEIQRWTDYETSKDSSWSLLKLNYVQ